jgi:hypothetical protein
MNQLPSWKEKLKNIKAEAKRKSLEREPKCTYQNGFWVDPTNNDEICNDCSRVLKFGSGKIPTSIERLFIIESEVFLENEEEEEGIFDEEKRETKKEKNKFTPLNKNRGFKTCLALPLLSSMFFCPVLTHSKTSFLT